MSRETTYAYDTHGNVTSVVRLAGTGNAVTTTFTYEPAYHQIASVTDPLNQTTSFVYDYEGRLSTITDPLNHQTSFTSNHAGQPLTITNALNETVTFGYSGGDLVSVTSPLGHVTSMLTDGAGRVVRTTDPTGRSARVAYDALDLVTSLIDALGGTTSFTYDANGNLLTLTDARSKTTTWTYNTMDRVATRADPLTRQESFTYDLNGNPLIWTDRKGQVTSFTHDALNRLTLTGFDTTGAPPTYASTVTTTYDAGDRATQIVDSGAGNITRTYDLLGRLTQEVTPEGTVDYTYDAAGRRATMTVAGQTAVSYTYDNADRLTAVTQGSASGSLVYDNANRRTSLTLPNGIVVESTYDDDSQLAGLTYKLGGSTIGDLTYTYDANGQRTAVGGSWARSNLPAALTSATYDDANQIATWDLTSFTYDANGNVTSDGGKTFTWNARNELTGLSGAVSASFAYDGTGRRRLRTVGTDAKQYLYDGLNPVQELVSGTPVANLLTGLGIDEYFTRTDGAGVLNYLTDALGSSIALADGSGGVQTEHTYEPFGSVSTSGASTGNTFGFTGREADGTGLYFYRARYYDPRLQRFIAEDPIGFLAGGSNFHIYADSSPTNYADPLGLCPVCPVVLVTNPAAVAAAAAAAAAASVAAIKAGQAAAPHIADFIKDLGRQFASHTKGKRPSTAEKHEKGDERRKGDQGGEKADWPEGPRPPPRKPPPDWKGPWPPKPNPSGSVIPPPPPRTGGRKNGEE
jgi:RHS repeat-associated protein